MTILNNFINNLSYYQIVLLYTFSGLSVMYIVHLILRRYFRGLVIQDIDSDFIAGLHAALFTITFLTLGYALSNADEAVDNYQHQVSIEANKMESLDLLLMLYESKEADLIRGQLRSYATSIVTDEWPELSLKGSNEKTKLFLLQLGSSLNNLSPNTEKRAIIYSKILDTSSEIVSSRNDRIYYSKSKLAPQFLATSNIGYLGVLIISALMLTQFTWFRFISLNIQIIAVSFIFASIIVLDNPFNGSDGVSPDPISIFAKSTIRNL